MGLITLCTFSTTDSSTGSKIRQPTVRVRTKPPSSTLFPKCAAASDKHRDISYPSLETAHVRLNTAASRCYNHNHSSLETARVRLNTVAILIVSLPGLRGQLQNHCTVDAVHCGVDRFQYVAGTSDTGEPT